MKISLQKLFNVIGYKNFHEMTPFDAVDEDGEYARVEWADAELVGTIFLDHEKVLEHNNLGWLYLVDLDSLNDLDPSDIDLHKFIREIW